MRRFDEDLTRISLRISAGASMRSESEVSAAAYLEAASGDRRRLRAHEGGDGGDGHQQEGRPLHAWRE